MLERSVRDHFDDHGLPLLDYEAALALVTVLRDYVLDPDA